MFEKMGMNTEILAQYRCSNDLTDPVNQDIRTQCALSWEKVVSEWRSVIAVSLNVGGGVRLTKQAKLYMYTQKHYKHNEDGRTTPGVRGHGSALKEIISLSD